MCDAKYILSVSDFVTSIRDKGKGTPMDYLYRNLDKKEQQELERMLLEQMEIQAWFSVAVIPMWKSEIFLTLN